MNELKLSTGDIMDRLDRLLDLIPLRLSDLFPLDARASMALKEAGDKGFTSLLHDTRKNWKARTDSGAVNVMGEFGVPITEKWDGYAGDIEFVNGFDDDDELHKWAEAVTEEAYEHGVPVTIGSPFLSPSCLLDEIPFGAYVTDIMSVYSAYGPEGCAELMTVDDLARFYNVTDQIKSYRLKRGILFDIAEASRSFLPAIVYKVNDWKTQYAQYGFGTYLADNVSSDTPMNARVAKAYEVSESQPF